MVFHNHAQPDPATASAAWKKATEASRPHLREHAIVDVLATSSGWIDTGLDLREGEEASLFSVGTVWLAKDLGIGVASPYGIASARTARSRSRSAPPRVSGRTGMGA